MRLSIKKNNLNTHYYVLKDVYSHGKRTTKIYEKLGSHQDIMAKHNTDDPVQWATDHVKKLNRLEKQNNRVIITRYHESKLIPKDSVSSFNGGYLFLQSVYYHLKLDDICALIAQRYKFSYDLNAVLAYLLYTRILYPSSKQAAYHQSKLFIEQPRFDIQHIYRALEVLAERFDDIQRLVYLNSQKVLPRNHKVLYYDCTNFYFEIEQEEGLKQYGVSKENKPNPLVQMGLFMDGNGIPLALSINPGNAHEQKGVEPLIRQIKKDFNVSHFIYCADAGLGSTAIRKLMNQNKSSYVVTQSIKKLKSHLVTWCLDQDGWKTQGSDHTVSLSEIVDDQAIYTKERWINEGGIEQRLIVSFSVKYRNYLQEIRARHLARAQVMVDKQSTSKRTRQTDPKRFVQSIHITEHGEAASEEIVQLDHRKILQEAQYDGFYAVCTTLEDPVETILEINKGRWEIEENFRIIKSELKARPVYLKRDDRIKAHFLTCFLSLLIYRILDQQLGSQYSCHRLLHTLREMTFSQLEGDGYVPQYTRTEITDSLHETFGFRTDTEIVSTKNMNKILKQTKKA